MRRNGWTACSGINGRHGPDSCTVEGKDAVYAELVSGGFSEPYEIINTQKAKNNLFQSDETWCVVFTAEGDDEAIGALLLRTGYLWEAQSVYIGDEWIEEPMFLKLECTNWPESPEY